MKRLVLLLLCFQLSMPVAGAAPVGALSALKDIDDFLTEQADFEGEAHEEEFDEDSQRQIDEFQAWALANPEEFAAMGGELEEAEESPEFVDDAAITCTDPNDPVFLWDAKSRKKKGKGKGKGRKCTAAVLKTKIQVCCLLFVRTKLGLPENPGRIHAKDYGSMLKKNGYCTIKATARSAPKGAILIYSGGTSGHIEQKCGENCFWFGPTFSMPASEWQSKRRNLRAAYTKCGGKGKSKSKNKKSRKT